MPQLLKLCAEINNDFLNFLNESNMLTQYYLISRYPLTEFYPASEKEAKEALECAKKIIEFIKKQM